MKLRRLFILLLPALLLLAGCGGKAPAQAGNKLRVTVSAFPEYDFVRAVAGDLAEITLLLPPGAEVHTYEPTPQDIARIGACRVFVYGGGESDVWLDRILDSGDREGKIILSLMDCCALREEEIQEFIKSHEQDGIAFKTDLLLSEAGDDPLKKRPGTVFDPATRTTSPVEQSTTVDTTTFAADLDRDADTVLLHLASADGSVTNDVRITAADTGHPRYTDLVIWNEYNEPGDRFWGASLVTVPGALLVRVQSNSKCCVQVHAFRQT